MVRRRAETISRAVDHRERPDGNLRRGHDTGSSRKRATIWIAFSELMLNQCHRSGRSDSTWRHRYALSCAARSRPSAARVLRLARTNSDGTLPVNIFSSRLQLFEHVFSDGVVLFSPFSRHARSVFTPGRHVPKEVALSEHVRPMCSFMKTPVDRMATRHRHVRDQRGLHRRGCAQSERRQPKPSPVPRWSATPPGDQDGRCGQRDREPRQPSELNGQRCAEAPACRAC
jgi:hypothetical protein